MRKDNKLIEAIAFIVVIAGFVALFFIVRLSVGTLIDISNVRGEQNGQQYIEAQQ